MASSLESQLAEKVREGRVPQAVVFAAGKEGKTIALKIWGLWFSMTVATSS